MELLAPAGDFACLEAAIDAGADAVYAGLSLLNARRGARNFTPAEIVRAAELCRGRNVRLYLTLNTDIAVREVGAAARIAAFAATAGVSALIVRDFATIRIWNQLRLHVWNDGNAHPALHLSTQAAITNPEGALMAKRAGVERIILARELSLPEIARIASESGVEIEVFAQGALCHSISGRCLMSSWGGGRSGNRGLCASPCRVPWSVNGENAGAAMSMRDLSAIDRLAELSAAGVRALKIEGRLKKPEWVKEAVELYRRALGPRGGDPSARPAAEFDRDKALAIGKKLAAYAGRDVTSAYFDGCFERLTGNAARAASPAAAPAEPVREDRTYSFSISPTEKGLVCRCLFAGGAEEWRMPRTRITRENKAVSIRELFAFLEENPVSGVRLARSDSDDPEFRMPPRNVNAVVRAVGSFINRSLNSRGKADSLEVRLPPAVRESIGPSAPHPGNRRILGDAPNRVRLTAKQALALSPKALGGLEIVIQDAAFADVAAVARLLGPESAIMAFPDVFFEGERGRVSGLATLCREKGLRAEANCWGSLWLCRECGLRFSAGPGLAVLNHAAAGCLREFGAGEAAVSVEAGREQIEDLCRASPLPLSLTVYSRPVLAYSRIPLEKLLPGGAPGDGVWTDRRDIRLRPERSGRVTMFRSLEPFSWAGLHNDKIKVANIVADLCGSADPAADLAGIARRESGRFPFNYGRGLK